KNEKMKKNKYYSFLQIAQIFCGLNICNERYSFHEYDSDVQFLILLDLCNIKMPFIISNYFSNLSKNEDINENSNCCSKNDLSLPPKVECQRNTTIKIGSGRAVNSQFTFKYLFLNSNKIFLEILIRHCLFLIFNESTNEIVRDKSIKFILFFTKLLKHLLQACAKMGGNENVYNISIVRDIKIYVHFVVNIIMPKALNALKKNINDFTKLSLEIILTSS
ncbi:hypothetical protein PMLGA01_130010300, partial [Plasmodium malariae]